VTTRTTRRLRSVGLATAALACAGAAAFAIARSPAATGHVAVVRTTARLRPGADQHPGIALVSRMPRADRPPVRQAPPGQPVPILMYHVIGSPPPGARYPGLFVSPADFRAQMLWLRGKGFHPVTLTQLWRYRHGGHLPVHPIVLTFDDGYRGDATLAMPLLHRLGWPAVLDLLVANLHRHGWGLHPSQVRQMAADGWEIASHTLTHPDLTTLSAARLRREVTGSRRVLQTEFGQPVDFFCYPAGQFDSRVIAAVRRAGYLAALTELPGDAGTGSPAYELPRIRIADTTTLADLAAALLPPA
jgi:peptidoglycan/xylan/chitin deacetylase (PgdA/CDA1 family)